MHVHILRGLSGSGKSTMAQSLVNMALAEGKTSVVCSADDFFMVEGRYEFDPSKLDKTHDQCKSKFEKALAEGVDVIILDNTNTQHWEYQPYVDLAVAADCPVTVHVVGNPKDWSAIRGRNVHGVPDAVLRKQSERWED